MGKPMNPVSIRKMFRVDRKTHRYLIEPISEMEHIKCAIQKRFLAFTDKLSNSPKYTVRELNRMLGKDCRSITGANLRRIMLECNATNLKKPTNADISRHGFESAPVGEEWRGEIIRELIGIRDGTFEKNGWSNEEISEVLLHLCTT